jgi:hypothetical protein
LRPLSLGHESDPRAFAVCLFGCVMVRGLWDNFILYFSQRRELDRGQEKRISRPSSFSSILLLWKNLALCWIGATVQPFPWTPILKAHSTAQIKIGRAGERLPLRNVGQWTSVFSPCIKKEQTKVIAHYINEGRLTKVNL